MRATEIKLRTLHCDSLSKESYAAWIEDIALRAINTPSCPYFRDGNICERMDKNGKCDKCEE